MLRDLSFDVEPGQVIGVVGPTGSGQIDRDEPVAALL